MKYAIIAAGEGSRLSQEGVAAPKPMVQICGTPLIERLIKLFARHNAESISIIVNTRQPETTALLHTLQKEYPLNIVVKDTPSSMHSLHALAPYLRGGKFCLTTVDTIFKEEDFCKYIKRFDNSPFDGTMAVTEYIDDEKPLYITTDNTMRITAFTDAPPHAVRYISGGIYGLTSKALDTLEESVAAGESRMRNFQRRLIADGLHLEAFPMRKIIDIDHAEDIAKAEEFIKKQ
ncbi:MAG: NDP-sugar synthase [Bacteroidaceae bacterium]|nr:NDP-sugar synthase [Bacteroidaceae bacterium]